MNNLPHFAKPSLPYHVKYLILFLKQEHIRNIFHILHKLLMKILLKLLSFFIVNAKHLIFGKEQFFFIPLTPLHFWVIYIFPRRPFWIFYPIINCDWSIAITIVTVLRVIVIFALNGILRQGFYLFWWLIRKRLWNLCMNWISSWSATSISALGYFRDAVRLDSWR